MDELVLCTFETIVDIKHIPQDKKIRILKECINFGVDINYNNSAILFSAISHNDYDIVYFLIDNGINVTAMDNEALIDACCWISSKYNKNYMENRLKIIKLLISSGANPSAQNNHAIIYLPGRKEYADSNITIVKLLVEHGADPFAADNALFNNACINNNLELVKYLITIGVNCNSLRNHNVFCGSGTIELKKLLLDNGYDPNTIYEYNQMCLLELSICIFDIDSCKLLFQYGADIDHCHNIINKRYQALTAYFSRYSPEKEIQLTNLFLEHGFDISEVFKHR
jgi:hypothetical protein